jgi:hypothetical protein
MTVEEASKQERARLVQDRLRRDLAYLKKCWECFETAWEQVQWDAAPEGTQAKFITAMKITLAASDQRTGASEKAKTSEKSTQEGKPEPHTAEASNDLTNDPAGKTTVH